MKILLVILIVICCPLLVIGQDLEVAGKAKIETMDSDNTANSVVVRLADGTLAIRDASTIPNLLITVYDTIYQVLSISNDTIYLSNGGFVKLPQDQVDDSDSDPLNEKISSLMIMGDSLSITEGVMTMKVAVDSSNINEIQTISRAGGSLTVNLTGGGSFTDSIRSEMDIDALVAGDIRDSINVVREEVTDTAGVLRGLIGTNTLKTGDLMDSITAHREVLDGHWDSLVVHREALDILFASDTSATNEIQSLSQVLTQDSSADDIRIKNLKDPTDAQDAATKAYVDVLLGEIDWLKSLLGVGEVTDIEGHVYPTVQIGTQFWMAKNLNVGIRIDSSIVQTDNSTIEKYCYGDMESNCDTYGGLYTWSEMMQYVITEGVQGICPSGWHVPTDSDWDVLRDSLDPNAVGNANIAGGKMKEAGLAHWNSPNLGATNESGFSGLPGGQRSIIDSTFDFIGINGYWWSSSENSPISAMYRVLSPITGRVFSNFNVKVYGLSVRCLRD